MMGDLEQIRVPGLMTPGADLDLGGGGLHRIFWDMQRVTTGACHVARGMRTRGPIVCGVRLVAGKTLRILLVSRRERFWSEVDHARERSAPCCRVRAAR